MFFSSKPLYDPQAETPDLTGKVAVVTGGTAGLGYESVKHLASHGAKVYMTGRDERRAEEALAKLRQEGVLDKGSVEYIKMDVSSIRDAKRAADEIVRQEDKVDILLNNAAASSPPERTLTDEGIVNTLATNHFGHFAFTATLLPLLKKAAAEPGSDVRIVNMTSQTFSGAPDVASASTLEDLDTPKEYGIMPGFKRYSLSKLCNIWFTHGLQKRLSESGADITVIAPHPGAAVTPGSMSFLGSMPFPFSIFLPFIGRLIWPNADVGAYSAKFATTSVKVREDRDRYKAAVLEPPNKIMDVKVDEVRVEEFWKLSERVTEEVLAKGSVAGLGPPS